MSANMSLQMFASFSYEILNAQLVVNTWHFFIFIIVMRSLKYGSAKIYPLTDKTNFLWERKDGCKCICPR